MKLKTGHYYRWTGPKKRQDEWNSNGEMDFILDGKPHLCTFGSGDLGKFEDSSSPDHDWSWHDGFNFIKDCGTNGGNMDKKEAMKRLDAIEEEAQKLREIIEKGDKIVYAKEKLYVAIKNGDPYILAGDGNGDHFRFYTFSIPCPSEQGWSYANKTGQECIDSHVKEGFDIHAFDDTKEAMQFFIDHL